MDSFHAFGRDPSRTDLLTSLRRSEEDVAHTRRRTWYEMADGPGDLLVEGWKMALRSSVREMSTHACVGVRGVGRRVGGGLGGSLKYVEWKSLAFSLGVCAVVSPCFRGGEMGWGVGLPQFLAFHTVSGVREVRKSA